jgi:Ca2+-binding RTX toxin-like protein
MPTKRSNSRARLGALVGAAAAALLAFPAAASAGVTSSVTNGDLVVSSDAGDPIVITDVEGKVKVNGQDPGSGPAPSADIDSIDGGGGNDTINGSKLADTLEGGDGGDRIIGDDNPANTRDSAFGDAGDDTMVWDPGDDDINEGGDGNDTVEVDGGGGPEKFEVNPSATAGRVSFDRTDPAPFKIDIGTSERLLLNAAGGDDKITAAKGLAALIASTFNGDDGDDRVRGTDGEDLVTGGKDDDVIRARDKAADEVECSGGFDVAFVDTRREAAPVIAQPGSLPSGRRSARRSGAPPMRSLLRHRRVGRRR